MIYINIIGYIDIVNYLKFNELIKELIFLNIDIT